MNFQTTSNLNSQNCETMIATTLPRTVLNAGIISNEAPHEDDITDHIDVVICSYKNDTCEKKLIYNVGVELAYVEYNLGGTETAGRTERCASIQEAIEFYDALVL